MFSLIILLSGLLLSGNLTDLSTDSGLIGQWTNGDHTRVIEFVENASTYDGIIRKADDPALLGKKQITGLKQKHEKLFDKGTLHIFRKNKTAKCSARLIDENSLQLTVSIGLFSKSDVWTRVEP